MKRDQMKRMFKAIGHLHISNLLSANFRIVQDVMSNRARSSLCTSCYDEFVKSILSVAVADMNQDFKEGESL